MRISSLFIAALLLASCSRGKPADVSPEELATFLSDPVTGTVDETPSTNAFANIPKDRQVQFRACLKDVAVQERIIGAKFRVKDGSREVPLRRAATDQSGCIYWSETFPFDATQRETFYEIERKIEATTVHQGEITVRVGVNPWKKGADSVRDLSVNSSLPTQKFGSTANSSTGEKNSLVVESVATNLDIESSSNDGASAHLQLTFEPKLRRIGLDGSTVLDSLTTGKFKVTARIVAVTVGESKHFTDTLVVNEASFVQGKVRAEGNVKLLQKIRRESSLELEFTAEPLDDSVRKFGVVNGRSVLGRLTGLSFSANRELKTEALKLEQWSASPEKAEKVVLGFELGRVSVKEVVVPELDSSGRPASLELEFRTLVKNGVTQEIVLGQDFEVNGQTITTDPEEGYLRWKEVVPFDFFAKQDPILKTIKVKAKNKFYAGTSVSRNVYLNLWEYESPANVAIDEEKDGKPSPSLLAGQGGNAELTLSTVMFNFLERSFDVDAQLNLSTSRKYRLEIAPEIRRMSRNKGWLNPIGLGNGRFMVHFLIETTDQDNPEVIDAQSIEMEARNGKIAATVSFKLPDIRYAAVRTNLTVQVVPLDRSTSLISKPHMGTFDMLGGFAVRFEPRSSGIEDRMKLAPSRNGLLKFSGAELYAKAKNIEVVPTEKLTSLGITNQELEAYQAGKSDAILWKLCGFFFEAGGINPWSEYKRCSRDPKAWIGFARTEHMNKLYAVKQVGPPEASQLGISAGMNYSMGESHGTSKGLSHSVSTDVGAKIKIPFLSILGLDVGWGFGYGASASQSTSWSKDKGHGQSRGYDEGKSINVDEIQFAVDADVDQCTAFTTVEGAEKRHGFMFCGAKPLRKKWTEHYYHIFQSARPGPVQDDGAPLNDRPLIALVRGTKRYNELKKILQDPEITLNLEKSLPVPYKLWKESEQRYDGFFPGLLTP
jgi:hypothetical protein